MEQSSTESSTPSTSTTTTTETTTTTTTPLPTSTASAIEEETNSAPIIRNRVQLQRVTSGLFFKITIPEDTFYDKEDGTDLKLVLLDRNFEPIEVNSWIQFDEENRVIYGLALEDTVSQWHFNLRATDSKGESVAESIDISVQQHKGLRTANNEITLDIKLLTKYKFSVDWQIEVAKGEFI